MVAYSYAQLWSMRFEHSHRPIMRAQKVSRRLYKSLSWRGKFQAPCRSLDKQDPQLFFQPTQTHADGRLSGVKRVRRLGKTLVFAHQNERQHRLGIQH